MRANEIKKENKYRNSSISRVEGMKATLRLVPSLESVVKSFNQVTANIMFKRFNTNVVGIGEITFSRNLIGTVTVTNNGFGIS